MSRPRAMHLCLLLCAAIVCQSCARKEAARPADSTRDSAQQRVAGTSGPNWDAEFGQMFVVPSDSDNVGVVVYPEVSNASLVASGVVTLVNAAGDTSRIKVAAQDSQQCGDAPTVRLEGNAPATWSAGLSGRTARLVRTDSIESLAPADSARLTTDLARLASALPAPKDSRFTGVPFAVVSARRFQADGRQFLVAHLVRRLNQEAAPFEERTFLIAERSDSTGKPQPYSTTFSRRSEGNEDSAEHFEVLAVVRGRSAPALLMARDQVARTTYEILERSPDGTWRSRWSRALSC